MFCFFSEMIKEDMLGDATKMTEALIEQERVAAETGTGES